MTGSVSIVEVSPRDGLQNDPTMVGTEAKVELITRAVAAGIRRIEAVSFVHPERVPQMADAEAVMAALPRGLGASYIGLVLNRRGLDRALAAGCDEVNSVVAVTDTFGMRNQGMDAERTIEVAADIIAGAREASVPASVTLSVSFGCPYEGPVSTERLVDMARRVAEAGPAELAIADTIGVAAPNEVAERVRAVRSAIDPSVSLRVHFHNTRNTAGANVAAAVTEGVTVVDSSLGGIGGCPFAPNATGNVATEDIAYLLERMGYDTGTNLDALCDVVRWMESDALLNRPVPGLLAKAGLPPHGA